MRARKDETKHVNSSFIYAIHRYMPRISDYHVLSQYDSLVFQMFFLKQTTPLLLILLNSLFLSEPVACIKLTQRLFLTYTTYLYANLGFLEEIRCIPICINGG